MIYLDHNATTPVLEQVVEQMLPYLSTHFGNPSSNHPFGRRTREAVENARQQVANLLDCESGEVIFTSGGTEANNLAIRCNRGTKAGGKIVTSTIEHPATVAPCAFLERNGSPVQKVPVDSNGQIDLSLAAQAIDTTTSLVTVMHANNETGTIQPISKLAQMAAKNGALIHTDAAQSVGKIPTKVDELGVDLLSVAGHKLYAPKGVGALYVRNGVELEPLVLGAGHERGLRPGTENVASIVGLGAACEIARQTLHWEQKRQRELTEHLFKTLNAQIPDLILAGHLEERLPNTLNVLFPGISANALLAQTDQVAASTGSACHDNCETPSSVLTAMGIEPQTALGAVRLSAGKSTTISGIETAANALIVSFKKMAV